MVFNKKEYELTKCTAETNLSLHRARFHKNQTQLKDYELKEND